MIVCIAEKPSVARDIAQVLGATTRRDGYIEGNGYAVTWVYGHLCELKDPADYLPQWKTWTLGHLPMLPTRFGIRLREDEGAKRQFNIIKSLIAKAERVVNCGDAGQEGELIQRWVMQLADTQCPVQRLWISSLTEEAIREGFATLKDECHYESLYHAGMCRAIGDWVLGLNATRLYTMKYGNRGAGVPPLSVGRVQTPTLALIVRRQREIEQFQPEPYWVLSTRYRDTLFTATQGRFSSEDEGQAALDAVRDNLFEITDISAKRGSEAPPRLFDLTSLQVECNKRMGFTAEQTLNTIQSLYEKKYTTYPRVDTTYLSDDIYGKCKGILAGIQARYPDLIQALRGRPLKKSKKVFDTSKVTDHHAIIPTGVNPTALTVDELRVYELIALRFIAVFYDDCKFSTTTALGKAGEVTFKVTGKQIIVPGWRVVFDKANRDKLASSPEEDTKKPEDEERTLPPFVKGEQGPHTPELTLKSTQPPKPYTEATLLRAMETAGRHVEDETLREALKENGIGRPSTRAAIIQTLERRRYIERVKKNIVATITGCELIDLIHEDLLKSAELTGQWEKKLRSIERKEYDPKLFVEELKTMITQIVNAVLADNSNRRVHVTTAPEPPKTKRKASATASETNKKSKNKRAKTSHTNTPHAGQVCPQCGQGTLLQGRTALGCSRWREGCDYRHPTPTPQP